MIACASKHSPPLPQTYQTLTSLSTYFVMCCNDGKQQHSGQAQAELWHAVGSTWLLPRACKLCASTHPAAACLLSRGRRTPQHGPVRRRRRRTAPRPRARPCLPRARPPPPAGGPLLRVSGSDSKVCANQLTCGPRLMNLSATCRHTKAGQNRVERRRPIQGTRTLCL